MDALIANARFHFHKQLFETNTLTLTSVGVASNADTSSRGSKAIARRIVDGLIPYVIHAFAVPESKADINIKSAQLIWRNASRPSRT